MEAQSYFVLLFSRGGGLTLFIPISGDLTLFYFFQGGGGLTLFIPISGDLTLFYFFQGGGGHIPTLFFTSYCCLLIRKGARRRFFLNCFTFFNSSVFKLSAESRIAKQ